MLRSIFFLFLLIAQLSASCKNNKARAVAGDTIVYVTATGKKYHMENCRSLKGSKTGIGLAEAVTKGYTACRICGPTKK